MNRTFILDLGLFETRCGSIEWSEKIIRPLLEILTYANMKVLECGVIPPLYQSGVRYIPEPPDKELFQAIPKVLVQGGADCFPEGTALLKKGMEIVPIERIVEGDEIWGLDHFTKIDAKTFKGDLFVDAIRLNNGSTICLTADHHVYVLVCSKHDITSKYGCSCAPKDRQTERIRVSELKPYMILPQPDRLPFGEREEDPELAYVDGLFISDGWATDPYRFQISGRDGMRKELQKHEIRAICERRNVRTYWHKKYIAVHDRDWTLRMQKMGPRARFKHALSLNLAEGPAGALLRGIMADANVKNASTGRTFTTTSKLLATQVRVLHRMFACSTSYAFIEEHGGLGQHPIYRIATREPNQKKEKLLRVKSIMRRVAKVPCWDIQTSDNRVYLPEHDVTVSQCEDLAAWRVAELRRQGEPATFRILKFVTPPDQKLTYHIQVQRMARSLLGWVKGPVEDPSVILGMKGSF